MLAKNFARPLLLFSVGLWCSGEQSVQGSVNLFADRVQTLP